MRFDPCQLRVHLLRFYLTNSYSLLSSAFASHLCVHLFVSVVSPIKNPAIPTVIPPGAAMCYLETHHPHTHGLDPFLQGPLFRRPPAGFTKQETLAVAQLDILGRAR